MILSMEVSLVRSQWFQASYLLGTGLRLLSLR